MAAVPWSIGTRFWFCSPATIGLPRGRGTRERAHGRRGDGQHQGGTQGLDEGRRSQRQFDPREDLAGGKADRGAGLADVRGDPFDAAHGPAQHRMIP